MALFAPWLAVPARDDAVRAAGLARERYVRLVSAERPAWERVLAPVAGWVGERVPALASQVSERDIVRAGLDPAALPPAEIYAAKLVLGIAVLAVGLALSALVPIVLLVALPVAFVGYIFPTEYLGWLGRRHPVSCAASCPISWRSFDRSPSGTPSSARCPRWPTPSTGRATAATCLASRSAARSPPTAPASTCTQPSATWGPRRLEELDELAGSLAQARHLGKGVGEVLAEHERGLRDGERNRLLGAASTVQPKLAAILAGVYLPEFVLLIVLPLFLSTLGRL